MTAHALPSIASREKPARVRATFDKVRNGDLLKIPGRRGFPILGVLPEAVRNPFAFTQRMYDEFGPIHRFRACGNWNVQLVGPEANEFVLFDAESNFSAYGGWKPVFGRNFDGGLLLRDGADHQWHRRLIASAFKQDQLQAYLTIFARNASQIPHRWAGRSLDIYELSQKLTFANGYMAFLGRDAALATDDDLLAFRYMMRSATAVLPWALPGSANGRARWAKGHIARLLLPMLDREPDEERKDLAAVLIRLHRQELLTTDEVVAHLTFTIAASFDALSSGTVSSLYYLARNPEWQDRVRADLLATVASADHARLEELHKSVESEWAVKEALRLNAAAPVLWRRAVRDVEFQGHRIPSGTVTGVNPMLTHLLPELWDEPKRYNPGRFSPDLVRQRHRYAYVPFGSGAHGCLGANFASLQVRSLLRTILEEHELVADEPGEPNWYHWPNCRPIGGYGIRLVRRS